MLYILFLFIAAAVACACFKIIVAVLTTIQQRRSIVALLRTCANLLLDFLFVVVCYYCVLLLFPFCFIVGFSTGYRVTRNVRL